MPEERFAMTCTERDRLWKLIDKANSHDRKSPAWANARRAVEDQVDFMIRMAARAAIEKTHKA